MTRRGTWSSSPPPDPGPSQSAFRGHRAPPGATVVFRPASAILSVRLPEPTMPRLPDDRHRANHDLVAVVGPILEHSAGLGFLGGMPIDEQIDHALGFCRAVEDHLGRP